MRKAMPYCCNRIPQCVSSHFRFIVNILKTSLLGWFYGHRNLAKSCVFHLFGPLDKQNLEATASGLPIGANRLPASVQTLEHGLPVQHSIASAPEPAYTSFLVPRERCSWHVSPCARITS